MPEFNLDPETEKDLKILEDAVDFSEKKPEPKAETHEAFKAAAQESVKPHQETKEEPHSKPGKITIFDDHDFGTQEDEIKNGEEKKGIIDSLADKAKDNVNAIDSPQDHKINCRVKADAHVEFFDVAIALLCCFITKNYKHDNQSQFMLHKDRKKALADALSKVYEKSKKPVNPYVDLAILGLSCYAPIIIFAIAMRKQQTDIPVVQEHQPVAPGGFAPSSVVYNPTPQQPPMQQASPANFMPPMGGAGERGVKKGQKRGPYKKNG